MQHRFLRLIYILLFLIYFLLHKCIQLVLSLSKNHFFNFFRGKSLGYLYFQILIPIVIELINLILYASCRRNRARLLLIKSLIIVLNFFETNQSLSRNCKLVIIIFFLTINIEFNFGKNGFGLGLESVLIVHEFSRYRFGWWVLSGHKVHFR